MRVYDFCVLYFGVLKEEEEPQGRRRGRIHPSWIQKGRRRSVFVYGIVGVKQGELCVFEF